MDTFVSAPLRGGAIDLARTIVLVQGAILVAGTIEAALFAAAFGPAAGVGFALTAASAVATLATAARLGGPAGPGRRVRRWTVIAEAAVIATGIIDLLLSIVFTGAPIGLVTFLTRLVAPLVVIALVRSGAA